MAGTNPRAARIAALIQRVVASSIERELHDKRLASGKVEGVAHAGLKGADAALAEDDVLVALSHDVLGAHYELAGDDSS